MDIKQIKALAEIFKNTGLTSLEINDGGLQIKMEKSAPPQAVYAVPENMPAVCAETAAAMTAAVEPAEKNGGGEYDFSGVSEFRSPLAGIFYSAPSPDAKSYVAIGDSIKKGDTLCIIEAMKVMNELSAEKDGTVVDICAENGQIVEYGQVIFKIL